MHVPLRYTKARSLHLACLKTPPTARGFAIIGCRLSRHWILTFTSLAESSSTIFTRSKTQICNMSTFHVDCCVVINDLPTDPACIVSPSSIGNVSPS